MVAAYLRVSSSGQDLRTQRAAVERWARARGVRVGRWFAEKQSARKLARPELDALRRAVRRGEVRTVVAFALDRFSRSGIRDAFTLLEEFRGARCRLCTVAEGFDIDDSPIGDVQFACFAWSAQMEGRRIGERIKAARARVEAAGGRWGRPRSIGGALSRRVLELSKTRSVRAIAIALKIPRATVQDELSRARRGVRRASSTTRDRSAPRLQLPAAKRR